MTSKEEEQEQRLGGGVLDTDEAVPPEDASFDSSPTQRRPSLSDSRSSGAEVMRTGDASSDSPSILITSPTGHRVSISEEDSCSEAPSIIVTSPSDGSLKEEFSPPATPMTSMCMETTDSLIESDGEDYYEEYHLPNTHESAFVRHLSFRKRVEKTNIYAPEADRIECLLRNGEFERHGSIRKRILPQEDIKVFAEEDEFEYYDDDEEESEEILAASREEGTFSGGIERDIEKYLSEDNLEMSYSDDNLRPLKEKRSHRQDRNRRLKRCSSTPVVYFSDSDHHSSGRSFLENAQSVQDMNFNEFKQNVTIEDTTLKKIRECLDYTSYRDILNLSGRLTDMLSPKEVEQLISHSDRYRQYLNTDVIDALSLSYQTNMDMATVGKQDTTDRSAMPVQHPDSGFSSPKTIPDEEKRTTSADDLSSVNGASVEHVHQPQSLSASGKVIILAPQINLNSSTESRLDDSEDDNILSQIIAAPDSPLADDESMSYKRMISVTEGLFDSSDQTLAEHLGYDHRLALNRPRTDSMNNLEDNSIHPTPMRLSSTESDLDQSAASLGYPTLPPDLIPELSAAEEVAEERHWKNVVIGGMWRRIDMKVIAPYKRCVTHGGYLEATRSPVVVISSVYLPEKSRKDYNYVMNNLFMYVLAFVEQLVADDYVMVYLAGGRQTAGPGFQWMRKAYDMIDRRLRKNLKTLLVVHPSLWARTIVAVSRPFISSKFYRKLHFIYNLTELAQIISLDQLEIPDSVKQVDFEIMIKEKKKTRS